MTDFERKKERATAGNLVALILFEYTPATCKIDKDCFWNSVRAKLVFNSYTNKYLKDLFRDKIYGQLHIYGYISSAINKFASIVNPGFSEDGTAWKQLAETYKKQPQVFAQSDFWEKAFYTYFQVFNPGKTFQQNVSELKDKLALLLSETVSSKSCDLKSGDKSIVSGVSASEENQFPSDDEFEDYALLVDLEYNTWLLENSPDNVPKSE